MDLLDEVLSAAESDLRDRQEREAKQRNVSLEVVQEEYATKDRLSEQRYEAQTEERQQQLQEADNQERLRREVYGKRLGLPVAAHNGVVISIGGLTQRSSGNGMTKASVWHVVLDDDVTINRMSRGKGDLLCRPASKLGRKSMGIDGTDAVEARNGLAFRSWSEDLVTCKTCLKHLEKLRLRGKRKTL